MSTGDLQVFYLYGDFHPTMHLLRKFSPTVFSAFSIIAMIALWIAFAPTQAGGLASYIIVIGNSMEPGFRIGDLIITHEQTSYQIGDAVVYRNRELENFVFHRIIAEEAGRYVLQGDNNSWVDTYQPAQEEILGKLWLHVPRAGVVVRKIRNPFIMAFIAAGMGAILASGLFRSKAKGNRYMKNKSIREWFASIKQKSQRWLTQVPRPEAQDTAQGLPWESSFFALGLILFSSLIIGFISFSRPTSRVVQDDFQYQHLGIFSYLAPAPQAVYDSNAIKSGDPIFPRLTCLVDVNLQYTLIAPQAVDVTGSYQLTAVIREQTSGWQRSVSLQDETSFSGNTFGTTAKLDLCKMGSLTQALEQETDFHPGVYTLSVIPNVKVQGELLGRALDGQFDASVDFLYDRVHFYVIRNEDVDNPLTVTETEVIQGERKETNTFAFFGTEVPVPMLRWLSGVGLMISLTGLLMMGLRLQTLSRKNQAQFLRVKYDSLIVDVQHMDSPGTNCVEVMSIDALAKLAERFNAVILHVESGDSHQYVVQAGGTSYQFVLPEPVAVSAIPAHEAKNQESDS